MARKAITNNSTTKAKAKEAKEKALLEEQKARAEQEQALASIEAVADEFLEQAGIELTRPLSAVELTNTLHFIENYDANGGFLPEAAVRSIIQRYNVHFSPVLDIEADPTAFTTAFNVLKIQSQKQYFQKIINKKK